MADSPADVVQQLLIDLGLGSLVSAESSWPVYAYSAPDTPDSLICVYDTQGRLFGRTQIDGILQEQSGIQIMIRSTSPTLGYTKAKTIADALDTQVAQIGVTVGSRSYVLASFNRTSGVLQLGTESPASKRHLFTINGIVPIRQLA